MLRPHRLAHSVNQHLPAPEAGVSAGHLGLLCKGWGTASPACACRARCWVLGQCGSVERAQLGRQTECSSWATDMQKLPHCTQAVDSNLSEPWLALLSLGAFVPSSWKAVKLDALTPIVSGARVTRLWASGRGQWCWFPCLPASHPDGCTEMDHRVKARLFQSFP